MNHLLIRGTNLYANIFDTTQYQILVYTSYTINLFDLDYVKSSTDAFFKTIAENTLIINLNELSYAWNFHESLIGQTYANTSQE